MNSELGAYTVRTLVQVQLTFETINVLTRQTAVKSEDKWRMKPKGLEWMWPIVIIEVFTTLFLVNRHNFGKFAVGRTDTSL